MFPDLKGSGKSSACGKGLDAKECQKNRAETRYAVVQAWWGHSVLIFSAQIGWWTIYGRTVDLPRNFDTYFSI